MNAIAGRAGSIALACALGLLTLAAIAFAGVTSAGSIRTPVASFLNRPAPEPVPSPQAARFSVAVVVGVNGTVGSDVLAPYEVFARSGQFSVFTVAATSAPVPFEGGTSLVPDAHLRRRRRRTGAPSRRRRRPGPVEADRACRSTATDWVTARARAGARILGVCNGAQVLAETGLLDGRKATSHWSTVKGLRTSRSAVDWVRGQRYVQDGPITTTAGVTSGVPGALSVIEKLAGPAEAARVGQGVNFLTGP
jgi:transcriptional regulator GlxA family with amidase domain